MYDDLCNMHIYFAYYYAMSGCVLCFVQMREGFFVRVCLFVSVFMCECVCYDFYLCQSLFLLRVLFPCVALQAGLLSP